MHSLAGHRGLAMKNGIAPAAPRSEPARRSRTRSAVLTLADAKKLPRHLGDSLVAPSASVADHAVHLQLSTSRLIRPVAAQSSSRLITLITA